MRFSQSTSLSNISCWRLSPHWGQIFMVLFSAFLSKIHRHVSLPMQHVWTWVLHDTPSAKTSGHSDLQLVSLGLVTWEDRNKMSPFEFFWCTQHWINVFKNTLLMLNLGVDQDYAREVESEFVFLRLQFFHLLSTFINIYMTPKGVLVAQNW